jgi:hypothetical protein
MTALAYGALKMTPEEKERFLEQFVGDGVKSFRALTNAQADDVIDKLKLAAGQTPTRPQPRSRALARAAGETGDVVLLITPGQRERLAQLTHELIAAGLTSNYVAAVRQRATMRPSAATSHDAEKAIEALKALKARVDGGWRPSTEAPA